MLSAAISSLLSGAMGGPVTSERHAHVARRAPKRAAVQKAAQPAERLASGLTQRFLNRTEMQQFSGGNWRVAEIANLCAQR